MERGRVRRRNPDRYVVCDIVRAASGWLAATQVGGVPPSFGKDERAAIRRAAEILERGLGVALERAGATGSTGPLDKGLSGRECEIVALLSAGCTYKEVAGKLGLGYGTIHSHIKGMYKRFGVNSKVCLVNLFRESGGD